MMFSAMFDTAQEWAKFVSAPHLASIGEMGERWGSFWVEFTLDGMTADEAIARVRQFGGVCVLPCELLEVAA